jgi:hypothetical protein
MVKFYIFFVFAIKKALYYINLFLKPYKNIFFSIFFFNYVWSRIYRFKLRVVIIIQFRRLHPNCMPFLRGVCPNCMPRLKEVCRIPTSLFIIHFVHNLNFIFT